VSVIDASVGVKWFKEEPGSDQAFALLEEFQGTLYVPDLFVVEVSATIVRMVNDRDVPRDVAEAALFRLIDLIDNRSVLIERTPPGDVIDSAQLAIELGNPIKDCIYLVTAMRLGRPLITADARFAARASGIYAEIELLEATNRGPL